MHTDPVIPVIVATLLAILSVAVVFRPLKQPHVISYLIVGVIIGPHALDLLPDQEVLIRFGNFGVVLLMFFIGLEISPALLKKKWQVAFGGTVLQVVLSVAAVYVLGWLMAWPLNRIILLGFVVSLSSTAVVVKILHDTGEIKGKVGQDVLGVLLVQDLIVIPMLMVLSMLAGGEADLHSLLLQSVGGVGLLALLITIARRDSISLPVGRFLRGDREMEIFTALLISFGLAYLSGVFRLSEALGAFAAGMLVRSSRETQWVHTALEPFKVVFLALFFISIGVLIDLDFVMQEWWMILILVLLVLLSNTFINALILRWLGDSWTDAFYAGAMLAQIGEFSFLLAAIGLQTQMISQFGYQMVIAVISVTLLLSPAWIRSVRWFLRRVSG